MDKKTNREQEPEEMPFNMAQLYYFELHDLRKMKSQALISGNLESYKDALNEIFVQISFKLDPEEHQELEDKFLEANRNLNPSFRGNSSVAAQVRGMSTQNAKNMLKDIDMRLLSLMHKYHMLFPKIESGTNYDQMKNRYGIK